MLPIGFQGPLVTGEQAAQQLLDLDALRAGQQVVEAGEHGRVGDDPPPAPDDLGELAGGLEAVTPAGLGELRGELPAPARPQPPPASSLSMSASALAYQTSRSRIPAKRHICSRYDLTVARTIVRRSASSKPFSRAAITMLAASRLTSHSHGPGSVSSKSLRSKSRLRSAEASSRKFIRCASPHSWVRKPDTGVRERSSAMMAAAPR